MCAQKENKHELEMRAGWRRDGRRPGPDIRVGGFRERDSRTPDRDREHLRRWGGDSDYGARYAYGPYAYGPYDDGYYGGYDYEPGVSVYVDPY